MLERRELKGLETTYLSMKMPNSLYEFFRTKAFEQKKTVSLVIQEALEEYKRKVVMVKEGQEDGGEASIN